MKLVLPEEISSSLELPRLGADGGQLETSLPGRVGGFVKLKKENQVRMLIRGHCRPMLKFKDSSFKTSRAQMVSLILSNRRFFECMKK